MTKVRFIISEIREFETWLEHDRAKDCVESGKFDISDTKLLNTKVEILKITSEGEKKGEIK